MSLENNNSVINTESTNGYVSPNGNSTNNDAYNTNLNQNFGPMPSNQDGAYPHPPVKSPKDKKKTVMIIVGIVIAAIVLIAALAVGIHIAKEAKYPKYDLNDYIVSDVEVSGIVGDTKLMIGDTEITDKNASLLINWNGLYEINSVAINALGNNIQNYIRVYLDTDTTKLSNGDSVYIKVDYDNRKIEKAFGFKFTGDKLKVIDKVNGLKTKDELFDVFSCVDVSFAGYNGLGREVVKPKKTMPELPKSMSNYTIKCEYFDEDLTTAVYIKDGNKTKAKFLFRLDDDKTDLDRVPIVFGTSYYSLKNGIVVYLKVYSEISDTENIQILSDTKQFKVSGLGVPVDTSTKISKEDIDRFVEETNKEINKRELSSDASKGYYHTYLFENDNDVDSSENEGYGIALVSIYYDKDYNLIKYIVSYKPYLQDGKLKFNTFSDFDYCSANYYEEDGDIIDNIIENGDVKPTTKPILLK